MRITAGKFKNKQIKTIESDLIRPTLSKIRESLFNVLQTKIEDSVFLDLFAGSGIVGIEAASRGAKEVVFIEKNIKHYKLLKSNLNGIVFNNKTLNADSIKIIENFEEKNFDIIFSDPPYKTDLNKRVLEIVYRKNLLKEDGIIIIECDKSENFDEDLVKTNLEIIKEKIYGDTKVLYIK